MTTEIKSNFLREEIELYAEEHELAEDAAFLQWLYSTMFDLADDDDIPEDEIIEGAGERQIDLVRIAIDDSEQSAEIHLIQAKYKRGFPANTVSLMKVALDFVFKVQKAQVLKMKNVRFEKVLEARNIARQYGWGNIRVRCYLATLGDENDIPAEAEENRQNMLREYGEGVLFREFSFEFLGIERLYGIANLRRDRARKIDFDLPIVFSPNRPSISQRDARQTRTPLHQGRRDQTHRKARTQRSLPLRFAEVVSRHAA